MYVFHLHLRMRKIRALGTLNVNNGDDDDDDNNKSKIFNGYSGIQLDGITVERQNIKKTQQNPASLNIKAF